MRTRRDQVQAYRFVTRRIVSALLSGEPEAVERPMRRLGLSVFASTMIAALALAGVGIWGLVTGQTRTLSDAEDVLVVERDTYTRYVYVDGVLYPVVNLASAQLILGTATPSVKHMSAGDLAELRLGPQVGIPLAPDALPSPETLVGLPWRVCSVPPSPDAGQPQTTLVVGEALNGAGTLGDAGLFVAVTGPDGEHETRYLIWRDRLLRVVHDVAPVALGLSALSPIQIGVPLASVTTKGPELDVVRPEGFLEPTDFVINGQQALIGYIYETAGQHYVMTRDGLRPLAETTVALRSAIGAAQIRDITGAEVSDYLRDNTYLEPEGFPREVPTLHPANGGTPTLCTVYRGTVAEGTASTVEIFDAPPAVLDPSSSRELRQNPHDGVAAPDRIYMRTGSAALVRQASVSGDAQPEDTIYLVTSQGHKHAVGSDEALAALGYAGVEPVPVPADLLALVPTGVTLDVNAARRGIDTDGSLE